LELGETLKIGAPESAKRYATRQDGSPYGAHLEKVFQQRREDALKAMDEAGRQRGRPGCYNVGLLAGRGDGSPAPFLKRKPSEN
jgi:hypothetical protein